MVYAVIVAPATASGASDVPCHCFYTPEGNDSQRPARLGLLLGQAQKQADYAENGLANTRTAAMGATMHAPSGGGAVAGGGIDGDNTAGGVDVAAAASVAQAIFSDKGTRCSFFLCLVTFVPFSVCDGLGNERAADIVGRGRPGHVAAAATDRPQRDLSPCALRLLSAGQDGRVGQAVNVRIFIFILFFYFICATVKNPYCGRVRGL